MGTPPNRNTVSVLIATPAWTHQQQGLCTPKFRIISNSSCTLRIHTLRKMQSNTCFQIPWPLSIQRICLFCLLTEEQQDVFNCSGLLSFPLWLRLRLGCVELFSVLQNHLQHLQRQFIFRLRELMADLLDLQYSATQGIRARRAERICQRTFRSMHRGGWQWQNRRYVFSERML